MGKILKIGNILVIDIDPSKIGSDPNRSPLILKYRTNGIIA